MLARLLYLKLVTCCAFVFWDFYFILKASFNSVQLLNLAAFIFTSTWEIVRVQLTEGEKNYIIGLV